MMSDARSLLLEGRYRSAVDRAYYAMFHVASAALHRVSGQRANSGRGLRRLFALQIVQAGLVEGDFGRQLARGLDARLRATYNPSLLLDEGPARIAVDRASDFLIRVRMLAGGTTT